LRIKKTKIFEKWFLKLKDNSTKATILKRFDRIERENHLGDYKSVGSGIYELRFHIGAGYRIYFSYEGDTIILLLCGGDKSSQQQDIKKAMEMIIC
jgi:putative addiction module killer protein